MYHKLITKSITIFFFIFLHEMYAACIHNKHLNEAF